MAKQVKNSPKKTQSIFEQMAKAMVTPKPNATKPRITVVKPQFITKNLLLGYGFEPLKGNKYLLDGITIEKDKGGFYHTHAPLLKIYIATINDLIVEFERLGKEPPQMVDASMDFPVDMYH